MFKHVHIFLHRIFQFLSNTRICTNGQLLQPKLVLFDIFSQIGQGLNPIEHDKNTCQAYRDPQADLDDL